MMNGCAHVSLSHPPAPLALQPRGHARFEAGDGRLVRQGRKDGLQQLSGPGPEIPVRCLRKTQRARFFLSSSFEKDTKRTASPPN